MKFRRFGRIGSAALAAALMATSTAIVSSAYDLNGVVEYSDFGAQIWAMGTSNWAWTSGGTVKFEEADGKGTLKCTAKAADINPKGDDTVQFGLQFFTDKDGSNKAEFEIGDSYTAKVDYKLTGANGVISEGTIDISKDIVKDQYNPGIDGTFDIYKVEIPKADLDAYGDIEATVTVYDFKYVKGGVAGEIGAAPAEEAPAEEEAEAAAEEETVTEGEDTDKADTAEEEVIDADDDDDDDDLDLVIDPKTDYTPDEVNDNGYFRILSGADSGEASLYVGMTDEILDVYGIRYTVDFDDAEVADDAAWIGGGIGANSESTGWEAHEWGKASGEKEITPDFENGIIEWMDTEPIFSADDTYAHLWMQTWGGSVTILQIEVLDADGEVLWSTTPVEVEKEETPELIAPAPEETVEEAPAAGDVAAAAETSKGSPDTGVADVAAVAGLAVAAAGAFVIAKKRK